MTNPADDLYEIFKYWQSIKLKDGAQGTVRVSRFLQNSKPERTVSGWEMQRRAARCLEGISQVIQQMELAGDDVENERQYFNDWTHAVFAYPNGWEQRDSGVPNSALQSLGMFKNSARRVVPDLGEHVIENLRKLLDNEPSMTPPPGEFPAELYDYFTKVKFHLKHCIDNYESTNSFDLQQAAEHYRAAVFMMANGHFVTNPKDWGLHAAKTFWITKAKNFGNSVYDEAKNQLTRATVRALEEGGQKALEIGHSAIEGMQ